MSEKYNGWTNYPTWRIMLEVFYDIDFSEFGFDKNNVDIDVYEFSKTLKTMVEDFLVSDNKLATDYALAFAEMANYYEIAKHIIDNEKRNAEKI